MFLLHGANWSNEKKNFSSFVADFAFSRYANTNQILYVNFKFNARENDTIKIEY